MSHLQIVDRIHVAALRLDYDEAERIRKLTSRLEAEALASNCGVTRRELIDRELVQILARVSAA